MWSAFCTAYSAWSFFYVAHFILCSEVVLCPTGKVVFIVDIYTVFQKKTQPFVISSYLCFDSYELHENFQEVLLVVNVE